MSAATLLADLGRVGIRLSRRGDRLRVEAPAGTLTPDLREVLALHKPELLAALGEPYTILDRLLRVAEHEGFDSEVVRALTEAELTATAEQIAVCDPTERDLILRAYLRGQCDSELRRRGKVPRGETAPALCRHCGPVWVAPNVAAAAPQINGWAHLLGCPWCHLHRYGRTFPRPAGGAPDICRPKNRLGRD